MKRKNELDLNIQDYEGNTGLHLAIIDNNYEVISKIINLLISFHYF